MLVWSPFHLIDRDHIHLKKNVIKEWTETKHKKLHKYILANTSAIWQEITHTTYRLPANCSTRANQNCIIFGRIIWRKVRRMDHWQKNSKTTYKIAWVEIGKGIQMTPEIPDWRRRGRGGRRNIRPPRPSLPLGNMSENAVWEIVFAKHIFFPPMIGLKYNTV